MGATYLELVRKVDKLPIHMDWQTLDIYCEYLLNDDSKYVNYSNLSNMREYFNSIDPKTMMTSDATMARYQFITSYLEGKLEQGIVKSSLCVNYAMDQVEPRYRKIVRRDILNSIDPGNLKKKDIEFINDMVFTQLNTIFMHRYKIGLTKMIEDLNNGEFGKNSEDAQSVVEFMQQMLNDMTRAQRRSKQENRFNLSDPTHFKAMMTEACERANSESSYLKTSYVGLNRMLNGGLENARCYNFIGATGGFKSGLLLNLMKSIKIQNKGKTFKDPTKRPTILFISQENNIWETIYRIYNIFTFNEGNIKGKTVDAVIEALKNGGFGIVSDEDDIDIEFRYYGNKDIGVDDIRGIVEELDNSGREVICVIQDYIERLRPPNMKVDRHVQLSDVSNQLHDAAIDLDIPIVTASQFNRFGTGTIEELRNANKYDIGKQVGSKDVSESFGMLKNFDANISIVIEYDKEDSRYWLSFRLLKFRGDDSNSLQYFLQPFMGKDTKIQLCADMGLPEPLMRESMSDEKLSELIDSRHEMLATTASMQRGLLEPKFDTDMDDIAIHYQKVEQDMLASNANLQADKYGLPIDSNGYHNLKFNGVDRNLTFFKNRLQLVLDRMGLTEEESSNRYEKGILNYMKSQRKKKSGKKSTLDFLYNKPDFIYLRRTKK